MNRFKILVVLTLLTVAVFANAQEFPKAEAAVTYNYVRTSSTGWGEQFNMNGASGSITFNFNKVIGLQAEFGGVNNGNILNTGVDGTVFTYLFGPKFTYRQEKFSVYGVTLLGGARIGGSISSDGMFASGSNNSMAMVIGGGFDINAGKRFAIRPAQLDYFMTRFNIVDASETQNNLRYSAGVVFKF